MFDVVSVCVCVCVSFFSCFLHFCHFLPACDSFPSLDVRSQQSVCGCVHAFRSPAILHFISVFHLKLFGLHPFRTSGPQHCCVSWARPSCALLFAVVLRAASANCSLCCLSMPNQTVKRSHQFIVYSVDSVGHGMHACG